MTGRERILATVAGHATDHLAFMPITMMFAADILGAKYGEYARDYRVMADAQVKTAGLFGFDHVSCIGPPGPEAADVGAAIKWYEDQPPAMIEDESLLADKRAFAEVRARGAVSGERIENRVRGVESLRRQVGNSLLVEGWVSGPCAQAADLRGINRLMTDFADDPEFVSDLFAFSVELAIRFAIVQLEAGADSIGVGDAAASLVGPLIYKHFVWPWEKKLIDAIQAHGGIVRLHICGNTRRILPEIGKLGCELVDIDSPVPLEDARAQLGPLQAVTGNLDPVRDIRNGSAETITRTLNALRQKAGERWVVAAGCEIVRDTPHDNLRAIMRFAQSQSGSSG